MDYSDKGHSNYVINDILEVKDGYGCTAIGVKNVSATPISGYIFLSDNLGNLVPVAVELPQGSSWSFGASHANHLKDVFIMSFDPSCVLEVTLLL